MDSVERRDEQLLLTVRLHTRAPRDMTFEPGDTRFWLMGGSAYERMVLPVDFEVPLPTSHRANPYVWAPASTTADWLYLLRISIEEALGSWTGTGRPEPDDAVLTEGHEGRAQLEINVDWGHAWPLWEDGPTWPRRYGLSVGLTRELEAWVETWSTQATESGSWRDESARGPWLAAGRRLAERVQEETRRFADVRFTAV